MQLPPLPDSAVLIGQHAEDWRAAVALAGDALVVSGATTAEYTTRMAEVIDEFGAYIVIAPGLALAHARPGPDVIREGLSVVTLDEAVSFGHPHNDPVRVVVGLAVRTPDAHVTGVAALANVFNDPAAIDSVAAAADVGEVQRIMSAGEAVAR